MRYLIFVILAFSSIQLCANTDRDNHTIKETIRVQLPCDETGKWKIDSQQMNNNGRIFTVWIKKNENQDEERIVIVSSPYKTDIPSINRAIDSAVLPVKLQRGSNWEILQSDHNEALLKWTIKNEKSALCKLILGQEALHSISYIYRGKNELKVDQNKWTTFLKYASLNYVHPSQDISQK